MQDGVEQDGIPQIDVFSLGLDVPEPTPKTKAAQKAGTKTKRRAAPPAEATDDMAAPPAATAEDAVPDTAPVDGFDLPAALAALGWNATTAATRDLAALAVRGTSTVLAVPHAPSYAGPLVAGLVARLAADRTRRALLLCPAVEESIWAALASVAAGQSEIRTAAALGPARAQRRIREGDIDLLVASPDTALLLHRRAALKPEVFDTVLLAWPLQLETAGEALGVLLADMKDATRLVVVDDAAAAEGIIERYGRKAVKIGFPAEDAGPPMRGNARTVTVSWERRAAAVADVLELLDPTVATVWSADRTLDSALAHVMSAGDRRLHRAVGDAKVADGTVICVDLPTPERLTAFASKGDVVLLVPPTADGAAARLLATRRVLRLPGGLEQATTQAASERSVIAASLESLDATASLLTLAPLFERHDPALVAAALHRLWTQARATSAAAAAVVPEANPTAPAVTKVFVGIGKKDNATVADLVAVLTKECRVEKTKIGCIELRDAFMLVELPSMEAERIATALNGASIRRKRITARVDRGMPARTGERTGFGGSDRDRSERGTFGTGRPAGRGEGRPPRPRE